VKRGIALEAVRAVLGGPESVAPVRPGRVVAQGMVGGQLLRVFADVDRRPPPSTGGRTGPEIVTLI